MHHYTQLYYDISDRFLKERKEVRMIGVWTKHTQGSQLFPMAHRQTYVAVRKRTTRPSSAHGEICGEDVVVILMAR